MYKCMRAHACACMHTCECTCIHGYMNIQQHVHACACVCMHARMYILKSPPPKKKKKYLSWPRWLCLPPILNTLLVVLDMNNDSFGFEKIVL